MDQPLPRRWHGGTGDDYATVAYNAATGAPLWRKRYNGPGNSNDNAESVAVSPDGGRVFVTGMSQGVSSGEDYATVAYSAATGAQLWVRRYNDPGNGDDYAYSVAVSPGGSTVFVTGGCVSCRPPNKPRSPTTPPLAPRCGRATTTARYSALAFAVAVSPDGSRVFVTGTVSGPYARGNYVTIAYDAATGATLWVKTYSSPGNFQDLAVFLAVSPDGSTVFVTGTSGTATTRNDYATVAYDAATGAQLWVTRYSSPGKNDDSAGGLAVSPDGSTVFVTGDSPGGGTGDDYVTVAYNAATGAQQWLTRYNGSGNGSDLAAWIAVSPTGGAVFVTGISAGSTTGNDYATVAYNAATGAQQWVTRYSSPGNSNDWGISVAVSPSGGTVFVTGFNGENGTTIAYSG